MQLQLEVTAVANLKCAKWRKLSSSTRMMYDPYSMSNAGRRLGFNFRSSTTQASPLAMERMERPYNGAISIMAAVIYLLMIVPLPVPTVSARFHRI